jgi:hypothetical protein
MLLFQTSIWPDQYPTSLLTWWVYYLVFDMWMFFMLPGDEIKSPENNEE